MQLTQEKTHDKKDGLFGIGFSGSTLKYFAAALMVCDHLSQFFFPHALWLKMLGRLVAPIFLYMLAEGFYYTRNRRRYILQLLAGSLIMFTINQVLDNNLRFADFETAPALINNIFGTMFISALLMWPVDMVMKGIKARDPRKTAVGIVIVLAIVLMSLLMASILVASMDRYFEGSGSAFTFYALVGFPTLFNCEGGFLLVILAVLFYIFRGNKLGQMLSLAALSILHFVPMLFAGGPTFDIQWLECFAIIPLLMYNGKRGRGGAFSKWFFYIFYPGHIYLFFFIAWLIGR
ncbi:membrane protein [Clostridia bacterium]|nr:membrane protein [Clostridia bacterium]